MEEVDTYDLLDKLKPDKLNRCRKGTKACGRACCRPDKEVAISFDERIGVALSRAADYVKGRLQREEEARLAAKDVLRTARRMEHK